LPEEHFIKYRETKNMKHHLIKRLLMGPASQQLISLQHTI